MCRNFYTQKNFYTPGTFTRRLHRLLHQKLLQYAENFTRRNFYTQKPLHTEERFTRELLRKDASTHTE